jgi:nucleoside-diphosphate-sugar epimerase
MLHSLISFCTIGVSTLIIASSAHVKGKTIEEAKSAVESASGGTKHILEYAKAAGVKKIIYTGTFQNALHPLDSWNPITITENGKREH